MSKTHDKLSEAGECENSAVFHLGVNTRHSINTVDAIFKLLRHRSHFRWVFTYSYISPFLEVVPQVYRINTFSYDYGFTPGACRYNSRKRWG